jgi:uncharacterized protein
VEANGTRVIDCDGHITESISELAEFMDPAIRYVTNPERAFPSATAPFPTLDGIHYVLNETGRPFETGRRKRVTASEYRAGSPDDWRALLDKTPMEHTVLFTSDGLAMGWLRQRDYTIRICRAYNDYVAERFRRADGRMHPMALIPMQFSADAAVELQRAVKDLGLPGAMVASTGNPFPLGNEYYWPVYKVAADLGSPLGIHGGSNRGIGMDEFTDLGASHIVHHPIPLATALISIAYERVFEKFPGLRVAFLEGGTGWLVMLLERIVRDREFFPERTPDIAAYLKSGRVLVGCEGNDLPLPYLISLVGPRPFAFSSDYPHEADMLDVKREIEETLEASNLSAPDKAAILGGNAREFFNLE